MHSLELEVKVKQMAAVNAGDSKRKIGQRRSTANGTYLA